MTLTEKLWQSLDADHEGLVAAADVAAATKKYKKTIPSSVARGLAEAFAERVRLLTFIPKLVSTVLQAGLLPPNGAYVLSVVRLIREL